MGGYAAHVEVKPGRRFYTEAHISIQQLAGAQRGEALRLARLWLLAVLAARTAEPKRRQGIRVALGLSEAS